MGWTYYSQVKLSHKEVIAEVEKLINRSDYKVLASSKVGNTVYSAVKSMNTNEVFATIVPTRTSNYEFGYKLMEETVGPYEIKCPVKILNMLTPTENEWANEWRENCRAYALKKSMLNSFKVGTTIKCDGRLWTLTKLWNSSKWLNGEFYIPKSRIMQYGYEIVDMK